MANKIAPVITIFIIVLLAGAMTYPSIPKGSEVIGTSQGTGTTFVNSDDGISAVVVVPSKPSSQIGVYVQPVETQVDDGPITMNYEDSPYNNYYFY